MSLHFVTSAQAEDHVSSSDEARKTEGMIGTGGFVLGTKDKLSASMIDANTLRILEGDLIFCGRQVNITNYEEVTIQNGTPGLNSIALVVLNLKTDPSEVATIKVYEGTETDGDPVMPEYIEGDLNNGDTEAEMPLYAITKTGLSVGDPVAQFDVWVSEKEFRTSIDQVEISISNSFSNAEIVCEKWGPIVIVSWGGECPPLSRDSSIVAATGFPPCSHAFYSSTGIRANANAKWVDVNSAGELKFENRSSEDLLSCVWAGELIYLTNQV